MSNVRWLTAYINRLIPISILRLVSLNKALRSNAFLYDYATTEIYTQVEMCLNVLCATIPSLQVFLASANTGLLDLGATSARDGSYSGGSGVQNTQQGESRGGQRNVRVRRTKLDEDGEEIELTKCDGGKTFASVTSGRKKGNNSISSDDSEMAIMANHTVGLQYNK